MTRVLSALVLLPIVLGTVWFLPPLATLALAELVVLLAVLEFAHLSAALGARIPRALTAVAAMAACAALAQPGGSVEAVLLSATVVIGAATVARGTPGPGTLADAAAALFAVVYLGLGIGSLAAVRAHAGRGPLLLLMAAVMVSDSAQYYTGRALGRRPLAPAISPKKTVEGAIGGLVAGAIVLPLAGAFWLPGVGVLPLVLLGATISALGIVGDLFESLLKRSGGVKDSSTLIPGHGGLLDRIDSWLFAGPVYYVVLRYLH